MMRAAARFSGLVLASAFVACTVAPAPTQPPPRKERPAPIAAAKPTPSIGVEPAASSAVVEASPPPKVRSPFAYANVDPDDDGIVAPPDVRATCDADLVAAGIQYKTASLPVHKPPKSKITCGAPQVIVYSGSPAKIAYSPSVTITCTMALALARLERILQDEAKTLYGKKVVKIHHVGTYSCREMAAYPGWVSEHSYANAIDLVDFVLEDGRVIDVFKDFKPSKATSATKEGTFLRAVSRRMYDEELFSNVITPFFDKLHANHFHIDMARYRTDGATFSGAAP